MCDSNWDFITIADFNLLVGFVVVSIAVSSWFVDLSLCAVVGSFPLARFIKT
jgi:hypothetical protein